MTQKTRFGMCAGLVSTLICLALPVNADVPALTFSGGAFTNNFPNHTMGYTFNVTHDVTLTQLAFWDFGGDGLVDSHTIGVWDGEGSLLRTATIAAGTGATLDSAGFRLVDVPDLILKPGTGYVVGATTGATNQSDFAAFFWNATTGMTMAPGITYVGNRDIANSGVNVLTRPTSPNGAGTGWVGGSFTVAPSLVAAPEPGTLALLGFAVPLMGIAVRRRRS